MNLRRRKEINLYRISQTVQSGFDTYSDAIVAADSSEDAALIHPNSHYRFFRGWPIANTSEWGEAPERGWVDNPDQVKVEFIGVALPTIEKGVICASFHAG
jgi:hypothetical protein